MQISFFANNLEEVSEKCQKRTLIENMGDDARERGVMTLVQLYRNGRGSVDNWGRHAENDGYRITLNVGSEETCYWTADIRGHVPEHVVTEVRAMRKRHTRRRRADRAAMLMQQSEVALTPQMEESVDWSKEGF